MGFWVGDLGISDFRARALGIQVLGLELLELKDLRVPGSRVQDFGLQGVGKKVQGSGHRREVSSVASHAIDWAA